MKCNIGGVDWSDEIQESCEESKRGYDERHNPTQSLNHSPIIITFKIIFIIIIIAIINFLAQQP
jgi:hypothetical protein